MINLNFDLNIQTKETITQIINNSENEEGAALFAALFVCRDIDTESLEYNSITHFSKSNPSTFSNLEYDLHELVYLGAKFEIDTALDLCCDHLNKLINE